MQIREEFNKAIWYVLQKIKTNCIQKNDSSINYDVNLFDHASELEILKKLEAWNVIQIQRKYLTANLNVSVFITIQAKFNEILRKYEQIQDDYYPINMQDQVVAESHISSNGHKLNNIRKAKEDILKEEKVLFSKYCLEQDVEHFESTLKHFFEIGSVSKEDFQFLGNYSKTVKTFLASDIRIKKKRKIRRHKQTISDLQLPLPIVVTNLEESLKVLKPESPQNSGPKFPYKIPAGTEWGHIAITFLDDERVEIEVRNLKHSTNFKEMGMIGKGKVPTPSEQWIFLKVLAKCYGELSIKDPEAKDKYKKQKQGLSETLRSYFSIDFDPFWPYKSCPEKPGNSYKIKLTLIPPPTVRDTIKEQTEDEIDKDTLGIHEFLNEVAPQIVDY